MLGPSSATVSAGGFFSVRTTTFRFPRKSQKKIWNSASDHKELATRPHIRRYAELGGLDGQTPKLTRHVMIPCPTVDAGPQGVGVAGQIDVVHAVSVPSRA